MTPYVQALNPASAGFTGEEQQAWNNLVQEVGPHAIRLVSINHLHNYLNGDVLNFNLADLPDTLRPRGVFLQSSGDTTYTWWGELPDAEGYVGITANNTGKLIVVSGHTVSLNAAAIPYEKYWLYLSIHSSDGVTATTLREFVNPCFAAEEKAALPDGTMRPSTGFICYPNPASDRVTIAFSDEMNHQGNYQYQIFDALGSVRLSGVFQLSEGAYHQSIPFDLPAGMYTIRLGAGAFHTSKIIIVAQ